jgi:hypothetical protein
MFVAGTALTLPLAAGTANATFDSPGDGVAPEGEVPTSLDGSIAAAGGSGAVDSPLGHGVVGAGPNAAQVSACAVGAERCVTHRGSGIPVPATQPPDLPAASQPLMDVAELTADADGVVTNKGRVTVEGSIRVPGEEIGGSADATADGGSVTFDTPIGNGSTEVEGESFDILVN